MRLRNGGVHSAAGLPAAAGGLPAPCLCAAAASGTAATFGCPSSASLGMAGSAAAGRASGSGGGSSRGCGRRSALPGSREAVGISLLRRCELGWRGRLGVGGAQAASCGADVLVHRRCMETDNKRGQYRPTQQIGLCWCSSAGAGGGGARGTETGMRHPHIVHADIQGTN